MVHFIFIAQSISIFLCSIISYYLHLSFYQYLCFFISIYIQYIVQSISDILPCRSIYNSLSVGPIVNLLDKYFLTHYFKQSFVKPKFKLYVHLYEIRLISIWIAIAILFATLVANSRFELKCQFSSVLTHNPSTDVRQRVFCWINGWNIWL